MRQELFLPVKKMQYFRFAVILSAILNFIFKTLHAQFIFRPNGTFILKIYQPVQKL